MFSYGFSKKKIKPKTHGQIEYDLANIVPDIRRLEPGVLGSPDSEDKQQLVNKYCVINDKQL